MLNVADELKGDMAKVDALIAEAEATREQRKKSLALVENHLDNLHVQRMRLEGQIQRAEARLVRPTGPSVTIEGSGGVLWKV